MTSISSSHEAESTRLATVGRDDKLPSSSSASSELSPTRGSAVMQADEPIPHQRSVTFISPPPDLMEDRRPSQRQVEEAECSADETTAIIGSERGGGNNYRTSSGMSTGEAAVTSGSNVPRRLKSSTVSSTSQAQEEERHEGWWKRMTEKYGSVELENKGSVARDHLALERTFLAWLRTSLSFASIGIAVTQLFRLNTTISSNPSNNPSNPSYDPSQHLRRLGKPLGATFIAVSIVVMFIGFHRYFESQHYVIRGKFPASRGSIMLVTLIAGALIVSSLIVVLVIEPKPLKRK